MKQQGLRILSVCPVASLRRAREEELRDAGYRVWSAGSTGYAMAMMARRQFDLMVCDALPGTERDHLVAAFKTWHPFSPVLAIGTERARLVDDCLQPAVEPAILLRRVSALLSGAPELPRAAGF